ncbi:hypothetical protein ACU4GH_39480 [Bradyrhizobium betae]
MTRHLIQAHFGKADRANLAPANTGEKATPFDIVAYDKVLDFGIGAALTDLKAKKVYPSEIALDLAVTAAHVHAADTRISRATESEDAWTRQLRIVVPVSDVRRWTTAIPVLERMLNFLTGDRWTVQFRPRPTAFAQIVPQADLIVPPYTNVSLFSGGLDSFIGAIDQLEGGDIPLLVSHASEPAVSKAQDDCYDALKTQYPKVPFDRLRTWLAFPKAFVRNVKSEDSTRGRSFLFFALGVFAGTGLRQALCVASAGKRIDRAQCTVGCIAPGCIEHKDHAPLLHRSLERTSRRPRHSRPGRKPLLEPDKGRDGGRLRQPLIPQTVGADHSLLLFADQGPLAGSSNATLRLLPALFDPQGIALFDQRRHDLYGPKLAR